MAQVTFRAATPRDDTLVVQHFTNMMLAMKIPTNDYTPDKEQQCMVFIQETRAHYQLNTIIAEVDGTPIGSASMHLLHGLYPRVFTAIRKTGYIWGVWVDSEHRKKGVAAEMMTKAVEYLESIGCTRVVLHSSDQGKNIYKKVGFSVTHDEMDLTISKL